MLFRKATVDDAAGIEDISREQSPAGHCFTEGAVKDVIMNRPETVFIVAEDHGEIAGYIFLINQDGSSDIVAFRDNEKSVAQIADIAVAHHRQSASIGAQLIEHAAEEAPKLFDCARMIGETHIDNIAMRALFKKASFHEREILRGYYPGNRDALRYERNLIPRPAL